jgi:N-acetylmuramoyl-L-alanine amidase
MNWRAADIDRAHRKRGFFEIGYHFVIGRDGLIEEGRPLNRQGAHVVGFNHISVGICMVGGVSEHDANKVENNFTPAQFNSLRKLLIDLQQKFPGARVVGHRDLSPDRNKDGRITPNEWLKGCPSFDAPAWWESVKP